METKYAAFLASRMTPELGPLRERIGDIGRESGKDVWVARKADRELQGKSYDERQIVCLEKVRRSERLICVLDGTYGNARTSWNPDEVSILELEIAMAMLAHKPIHIFLLEPPSKHYVEDDRLSSFLKIVRAVSPNSIAEKPIPKEDVISRIQQIIDKDQGMLNKIKNAYGTLVQGLANGNVYGVPHWLCGHFVSSRDRRVAKAKTAEKLIDALGKANPSVPNLVANLLGSRNMPALYLDAWADTHGTSGVGSAITPTLDSGVMRWFKQISKQCETGGKNPCIDGTFDDDANEKAVQVFARGGSDTFLGYSERLNYMIRQGADAKKIRLSSAPLGEGKHPILFVDAFVVPRSCDAACQQIASRFAAYMNAPAAQEWIMMGRDKGTDAVPRYLLPATLSTFKAPAVKRDEHYKRLAVEVKGGAPYPMNGLPATRRKMRDAILAELTR